ncbi:evelope glycoprotein H [Ateline alphaherpesvirus 1]|uniref:Evelope glycoprotein H n=1 Tax=Herpesvirus ateles type 1 (strain Lennette) TaxID=35243 RepID=A0A1S6JLN9_HSVA1|nr:evelope glycoprotein H [Ateline alphaherpesvirus 1]AQS79194.1 evelope glycoprotein H [Ateline alphaherpesvirus 1]
MRRAARALPWLGLLWWLAAAWPPGPRHAAHRGFWPDLWTPDLAAPGSGLEPPSSLNLTVETVALGLWYSREHIFFVLSGPDFPYDAGRLLYVPKSTLVGKPPPVALGGRLASFGRRDKRRDVTYAPGLQYNPAAASLLRSRYLVEYAAVVDHAGLCVSRGPDAATERRPSGQHHVPPWADRGAPPTAPRGLEAVAASDVLNASAVWLDARRVTRHPTGYVYRSPSVAVWPAYVWAMGELSAGSSDALVRARYGVEFMSLTLSTRAGPPAEIVVVPRADPLYMVSETRETFSVPAPGPPPGPRFRVHLLSGVRPGDDAAAAGALAAAAAFPEESLNYAYHLSRGYALVLENAAAPAGARVPPGPAFWGTASRLATAGFAFVTSALESRHVPLEDVLEFLFHTRVLGRLALAAAAGGNGDRGDDAGGLGGEVHPPGGADGGDLPFVRADVWSGATLQHLLGRLVALAKEIAAAEGASLEELGGALRLFFLAEEPSAEAVPVAALVLDSLYRRFLAGDLAWTGATARALFLSASALLSAPAGGAPAGYDGRAAAEEWRLRVRHTLLLNTALCTSDVAAAANRRLRRAMENADHRRSLLLLPDLFSPCGYSLRFDLETDSAVLEALALARDGADAPFPEVMGDTRRAARVLAHWASRGRFVGACVPEVTHRCGDGAAPLDPLVVLPVAHNASFVVTRSLPPRGRSYELAGVNVKRPLVVTYLTAACDHARAEVEPKRLLRPESVRDSELLGAVFLRYTSAGEVIATLAIDTFEAQQRLSRDAANETDDVFSSQTPSTALLLFPNGTVIHLLAFDQQPPLAVSGTVVAATVLGVFLVAGSLAGLVRMLWSLAPSLCWSRQ